MKASFLLKPAFILVMTLAAALYVLSLDRNKLGFYHDDGIYVVTAQSIANGAGYRIGSLPTEPNQTKYPPMYPLLLSLIWFVDPSFPSNTVALLLPSVLTTLLCLFIVRQYLMRELYATETAALLTVILTAFNTRTLILASNA